MYHLQKLFQSYYHLKSSSDFKEVKKFEFLFEINTYLTREFIIIEAAYHTRNRSIESNPYSPLEFYLKSIDDFQSTKIESSNILERVWALQMSLQST